MTTPTATPEAKACLGCSVPLAVDGEFVGLTLQSTATSVWVQAVRTSRSADGAGREFEIVEMTPTEARALARELVRFAEQADPSEAPTSRHNLAANLDRASWSDTPENREPVVYPANVPSNTATAGVGLKACVYCHHAIENRPLSAAHGVPGWVHVQSGDVLCFPERGSARSPHAYPARTIADVMP